MTGKCGSGPLPPIDRTTSFDKRRFGQPARRGEANLGRKWLLLQGRRGQKTGDGPGQPTRMPLVQQATSLWTGSLPHRASTFVGTTQQLLSRRDSEVVIEEQDGEVMKLQRDSAELHLVRNEKGDTIRCVNMEGVHAAQA